MDGTNGFGYEGLTGGFGVYFSVRGLEGMLFPVDYLIDSLTFYAKLPRYFSL